ncbi:MAG: hypothetical protein ACTSRP_15625 [Candidatus Helarchaeota archaeon]
MSENKVDLNKYYDKVLGFIKELKPEIIHENKKDYQIVIPLTYKFSNGEKIVLNVDTRLSDKWIETKCLLLINEAIPNNPEIEHLLHKKLLQANFRYAEVTYSLDNEGNVYAEADMPLETDWLNFKSEYISIIFAIDLLFNKIIPEIPKEIKKIDTYNKKLYT